MSASSESFVETLPFTEQSANIILTSYYEVLRQTLEAITLTQGYKVYSHEAYTYFLKHLNEHVLAEKFDRLRKLRNGINYYGKGVAIGTAQDAKVQVQTIKKQLLTTYLSELY